jgi:hypothetical protein
MQPTVYNPYDPEEENFYNQGVQGMQPITSTNLPAGQNPGPVPDSFFYGQPELPGYGQPMGGGEPLGDAITLNDGTQLYWTGQDYAVADYQKPPGYNLPPSLADQLRGPVPRGSNPDPLSIRRSF